MTSRARPQQAKPNTPTIAAETDAFVLWSVQSGPFRNNTYLAIDRSSGAGAFIDPFYDSLDLYRPTLRELSLPIETILITHAHIDHVAGVATILSAYPGASVYAHAAGEPLMAGRDVPTLTGGTDSLSDYASRFQFPAFKPSRPTGHLRGGEPVSVGKTSFDVLDTPGHCPGHVAFRHGDVLISGDVLYRGSVGFTNIPGSDPSLLADTLVDTILPLGDAVTVYPGHGPITTIGRERTTNPFVLAALNKHE